MHRTTVVPVFSPSSEKDTCSPGRGLFNLVEGIIDHHLLTIHHVRDDVGTPLPWDLGFLAVGALLVAVGWWCQRSL